MWGMKSDTRGRRLKAADFHLDIAKAQNPNEPKACIWREEPLFEDLQPDLIPQRDQFCSCDAGPRGSRVARVRCALVGARKRRDKPAWRRR